VSKMHVLVIPSGYPSAENPVRGIFYRDQVCALARAGARVGVAYPDLRSLRTFKPTALVANHFQVETALNEQMITITWNGWNIPPGRLLLKRLFVQQTSHLVEIYLSRYGRPDVLHAHGAVWGGVAASTVAARHAIPYVITEHSSAVGRGLLSSRSARDVAQCYADAAAILTVSHKLGHDMGQYLKGRRYTVVPNVVDTAFFTPPPIPRQSRSWTLLAVASLLPSKGVSTLILAFAKYLRGPNVMLRIGGEGPERKSLECLAQKLGVGDRVQFLGRLTREQVRTAMWQANAFVIASRYETFGVVAIEALATGLPVVATRCGGTPELLPPETTVLANPDDVESLGRAMLQVLESRRRFEQAALEACADITSRFGPNAVADVLLDIYGAHTVGAK
jgi:glycosyltransferase involved in cell wall biosynthesis